METYINLQTVVNDEFYSAFRDSLLCPLCKNILINPMMCMKCQNVYCKKCSDDWSKKNDKCPNRCDNPNYQRSLEKNNILSKIKFKCEKCEQQILYNDVKEHVDNCKTKTNNVVTKRLKKLKKEEIDKVDKKGKLAHITCK